MNIFDLPVHPAADLWPMIDAEGLQELSDDIKENGLIDPLVIGADENGEMVLIDGRNRLAACKIAHVEPETVTLADRDIRKFIRSKNRQRRHIKKYQLAMADAMMFPEPTKIKRGSCKKQEPDAPDAGALSKARTVIAYANNRANQAPMLAKEVLAGVKPLSEAYKEVKEAEKTPIKTKEQRLADLAAEDSYLASQVVDDLLPLVAAEAAHKANKEEAARELADKIEVFARCFGGAVTDTTMWSYPGSLDEYLEIIDNKELGAMLRGTLLNGRDGIVPILDKFIEGSNNIVNFIKKLEIQDGNT